jgi:hypothetical protein
LASSKLDGLDISRICKYNDYSVNPYIVNVFATDSGISDDSAHRANRGATTINIMQVSTLSKQICTKYRVKGLREGSTLEK